MTKTFRLIFLGAGFSAPAGLPLGQELFQEVRRLTRHSHGQDNHLERDLARYVEYRERALGIPTEVTTVDFEEFLGFLDIEHYLGLKGKDTWSKEGNETQLMVRWGIAKVLHARTPSTVPDIYRQFVRGLTDTDWILTFNYDRLLETALLQENIPFRLFPYRYSEIGWGGNTVDNHRDELVVLKLHGSIDWFYKGHYEESQAAADHHPLPFKIRHPLFAGEPVTEAIPLTDGPRDPDDPLAKVYRVDDLEPLFQRGFWGCVPLILTPSNAKLFYAQPIKEFWWGLQRAGGLNLGLGVIGYSLPDYDGYARQALYSVFENYTGYQPDLEFEGRVKSRIRILDRRVDLGAEADLKLRYRFADPARTEFRLDGLNPDSLAWFLA